MGEEDGVGIVHGFVGGEEDSASCDGSFAGFDYSHAGIGCSSFYAVGDDDRAYFGQACFGAYSEIVAVSSALLITGIGAYDVTSIW